MFFPLFLLPVCVDRIAQDELSRPVLAARGISTTAVPSLPLWATCWWGSGAMVDGRFGAFVQFA